MEENVILKENLQENVKKERNFTFEVLRIISMLLIILSHVILHGKVLENTTNNAQKIVIDGLYTLFLPSVNVFVLISGYFLCTSKFKISKIVLLWVQVLFYSVIISLICMLVTNSFSIKDFIFSFLPIICKK